VKIQQSAVLCLIAVFALAVFAPAVFAQPVINEVMSSNSSTVMDEDGDFSDWIEIYNPDATDINLDGYGLSDDPAEPFKWVFPDQTLGAGEYVLVFASDKDRSILPNHWETVVDKGDEFKYIIGSYAIPEDWRTLAFDDAEWDAGPTGIGSQDGNDATKISQARSVFLRTTFNVADVANITHSILHIDYEDGFVAYINGVEIARANMDSEPGTIPAATKLSSGERKMLMYDGGDPEAHNIANFAEALQAGENVLAIEVHNNAGYFSDISVIPFLTFGMKEAPSEPAGVSESLASVITDIPFHTNFKIKSAGESLVLTNPAGGFADSLYTGEIDEDVSLGRKPDGGDTLVFFVEPSPGESNTAMAITGDADAVEVSVPGGTFGEAPLVELSVESEAAVIRYTFDGSEPVETSTLYTEAIEIDSTKVLRVRAFEDGKFPGPITTNTYLVMENIKLPIISISTNPENLWDEEIGIYVVGVNGSFGGYELNPGRTLANWNNDWERPIHVEMYEPSGLLGFSIDAGVKIVGKGSRGNPQKNFAIFARSKYGYDSIDYKIFPYLPTSSFQSLVLRAGGSEQNQGTSTLFRDGMHQTLMQPLDLEVQGYRPAVLFLNGEYWGIYNIREKLNEDYLANYHGVDPNEVDMLDDYHAQFVEEYYDGSGTLNAWESTADKAWTALIIEGDAEDYNALLKYMLDNDESDPAVYEYLKTQIDIDNYIDYMAARIYIGDPDGPGHNTKMWRPQVEGGKWRWLMYDTEFGSGLNPGSFSIKNLDGSRSTVGHEQDLADYYLRLIQAGNGRSPDANFLMYSMLENDEYKARFLNRYSDHMNTIFSAEVVIPQVEAFAAAIESEMPRHIARHDYAVKSIDTWNANVEDVVEFFEFREEYARLNVANHEFVNVSGWQDVTIDVANPGMGNIQISSLFITEYPWTGTYFMDVPVTLTAIPKPGYAFAGWTGSQESDSAVIAVTLTEAISMTASFVESSASQNSIVINEINYNSSALFEAGEWVELYNAYEIPVDVSGWTFKDSGNVNSFDIPGGSVIPAGGYLVLSSSLEKFKTAYTQTYNVVGDFGFGLNNAGEKITLFNTLGEVVDSLTFGDGDPWPNDPDGVGSTLELISPDLDNSLAESWISSAPKGTPGIANDQILSVDENEQNSPAVFALDQNFPNPFNPVTTIPFTIAESGMVTVEVYSILGRSVGKIVDEHMSPGSYNAIFKSTGLAAGIYVYTIRAGDYTESRQMMLLK
jgi:hypothetical protein